MRAFLALDLPSGLRREVSRLSAGLSAGRLIDAEDLHLTLAFFPDLGREEAFPLADAMESLTAPPVELSLAGVDIPGGRAPNLVWIKAEKTPSLMTLYDQVILRLRDLGLLRDKRRFRPHVTLARFGKTLTTRDSRAIGEFLALNGAQRYAPETADEVTLYQSHLHEDGSIYEPLASVQLTR